MAQAISNIHPSAQIHSSAIVETGAVIGANVKIGAFSYIEANVEIDENTEILTHVVIKGPTIIGKNNKIYQFASIGEACQDLKYNDEPTRLIIGDNNLIRESVTIHRGTVQDNSETVVGSNNLFMINVHIAHDCIIKNNCIFANNATLAGHVQVDDYSIVGGMSAIHQFCTVGAHSMIGGGSIVVKDVPPYVIAQGNHCAPFGINVEGLRRRGFSKDAIKAIRKIYKEIYRLGKTLEEAKMVILDMVKTYPELQLFLDFFENSQRGIIR